MPTHDFKDIGDVLSFDILRGTITAIDSATDTCTVSVDGAVLEALLFYHCEPDSAIRENGAIEGAASGFAVDDEVIVMKSKVNDTIKVIAHIDGVRHCSEYAVFLIGGSGTKSVAVVWNVKSNELVMGPIDTSDADYIDWIAGHAITGESMLGGYVWDDTAPYKIDPDLVDPSDGTNGWMYTSITRYHDVVPVSDRLDLRFPESIYAPVLIDGLSYAGFRSTRFYNAFGTWSEEFINSSTGLFATFSYPNWPTGLEWSRSGVTTKTETYTKSYNFYGPLGLIGSFAGSGNLSYQKYLDATYNYYGSTNLMIPDWNATIDSLYTEAEQYAKGREWYGSTMLGQFSDKSFAICTLIQYTPCTYTKDLITSGGTDYSQTWTFGDRTILVQAQAASMPENGDWQAIGNNTVLSGLIASGANMFYSLNSFPASELQSMGVTVTLMK